MAAGKINDIRNRVRLLDRISGVLDILSSDGPEMTLVEISRRIGLHKSTVHRLLMSLEEHRFVERSSRTGKYRLGLKLFELGSQAVANLDLRERARPYLEQMVYETGETAHLAILDEGDVLYVDKVEPSRAVRMASSVGRRNSVHTTALGKAVLAFMPEDEVDAVVGRQGLAPSTPRTITTPARLKRELSLVRERGWALDDEENHEGLRCVGAPVRDYSGRVVAAISVSGPAFRLTEAVLPVVAETVVRATRQLSAELGYHEEKGKKALAG